MASFSFKVPILGDVYPITVNPLSWDACFFLFCLSYQKRLGDALGWFGVCLVGIRHSFRVSLDLVEDLVDSADSCRLVGLCFSG